MAKENKELFKNVSDQKAEQPIKAAPKVQEPKTRCMHTLIGLANRTQHNVVVELTKDSVMLAPSKRTNKEFDQCKIRSVNGLSLQTAVSKGIVSIIR